MLETPMKEGLTSVIEEPAIEPETLRWVLHHIYGVDIPIVKENVEKFYSLAHYWDLESLRDYCVKHIKQALLSEDSVWEYIDLALVYHDPELLAACLLYICKGSDGVKGYLAFAEDNIAKASEQSVLCVMMMSDCTKGICQQDLFEILVDWAR